MNIIIFENEQKKICVCIPTGEMPIEETAKKDVPYNCKYKIIETSELPPESIYWDEFFDALEHDFTNDFDGIGER